MKLIVYEYEWAHNTSDVDINFFSDVQPRLVDTTIDLYDYYIKDTMGDISFSFEDIDTDNTLYTTASSLTFDCINDVYNGTALIDFFGCYESNKYIKWKLEYYNDNDELIDKFILYKDGINIDSIEEQIISFTVLGYEKEFKSYFDNVPIVDSVSIGTFSSGVTGLDFQYLNQTIKANFPNVSFSFETDPYNIVNTYAMARKPFTLANSDLFHDYGRALHLKTGYECFSKDNVNKFTFLNSLLLPMGWIWYFKLGKLIIQERADTSFPITVIDFEEAFMEQSLDHNYNQFQLDNVLIESGQYFDAGEDRSANLSAFCVYDVERPSGSGGGLGTSGVANSHNLGGQTVYVYSNVNEYNNRVRPFKDITNVENDHYVLNFSEHNFTRKVNQDEYTINLENIQLGIPNILGLYDYNTTKYSYNVNKTLVLNPYVNSRDSSGGFSKIYILPFPDPIFGTGYYNYGNFFYNDIAVITNDLGMYSGTVADSIFKFVNGKYENYEQYTQTERFKKNFKKFLKTNDEVILRVDLKAEITNPQQRIQITNYPYADIADKVFNIVGLSYNERNKTTSLTLQMETL